MSFEFLRRSLECGRFADMQPNNAKSCSRCGEWKLVDQFYAQPTGLLGRRAACIACHQVDNRRRAARRSAA